jgi:CHAT domain-containing protein/Tfp pilus assembly protein PilF
MFFSGRAFLFSNSLFGQDVPWAQNPQNPNNVVGNILAETNHYADRNNIQQPVGVAGPNSFSQPTPGQTQAFIDQNPALRNLDPMTKQSLVMGGQYGLPRTDVLNSQYINGQWNPFYQNGHVVPNWYLPSTWSSPNMNWQGVQPNGFASSTMTSFYGSSGTTTYNPTTYNNRQWNTPTPQYRGPLQPTSQPNQQTPARPSAPYNWPGTTSSQPARTFPTTTTVPAGDLARATANRERALALSETAADKVGQATNHAALAQLFVQQGQIDLALAHVRAAEKVSDAIEDPALHVDLSRTKGGAYMASGEFESAIVAYREALSNIPPLSDKSQQAEILTAMGWAYQSLGDIPQALRSYQGARDLFAKSGDKDGKVRTLIGLGSLYESIGELNKAIEQYRSAAPEASDEQFARMLVSNGEMYESIGKPADALARYEHALFVLRPRKDRSPFPVKAPWAPTPEPSEVVSSEKISLEISILAGMGRGRMALEQFEEAKDDFERALAKAKDSGNRAAEAGIIAGMGEMEYWKAVSPPKLQCRSNGIADQRSVFTLNQPITIEQGEIIQVIHDTTFNFAAANVLGGACFWKKPRFSDALTHYNEALSMLEAGANRIGEIGVLTNIGLVYDAQQKPGEALRYYGQALQQMDDLQRSARLEEFRIDIAGQSARLYQRAIELEAGRHHMDEAFNLSERARARTLLDQLGNPRIELGKSAPPSFSQRESRLRQENISLRRQLGQELAKPGPEVNLERTHSLQDRLAAVRKEYEEAVSQLKLSNPEYASFLSIAPLTLREAQQQLDPDVTVLSYFTTPRMTLAFVLTRDSFHVAKLPVTSGQLSWAVATFLDFAGDGTDFPALKFLYKSLIEPVKGRLKTAKLIVVPHGALNELPFAALTPNGKSYLNDRYAIAYLPSVSILPYVHSRIKPAGGQALVLANDQEEGVPQLGHAYDEARAVASLLGTQPLLGADATSSTLRAKAGDSDILHVTAHFDLDPNDPQSTRILLGQDKKDKENDEPSDLNYVSSLSLRKTNLVVLSGCQTQRGKRSRGDDVIGLTRAFMYAGTPSVVASLWSVDDEATQKLMIAFYTHLNQGLGKAEALRAAQTDLRSQYPHPYYWAGFVLTGDPGQAGNSLRASATR